MPNPEETRETDSTSPEQCTCDEGTQELLDIDPEVWADQADPNCPVHADSRQEGGTG